MFLIFLSVAVNQWLFFFTLQYCIGFAIHEHESATGIHVFPILNTPPSSLLVPSLWLSQCTSPKHPVSCIEPGLAIHFIYDIIHVSVVFWTLWERERMGWFGRMALIMLFDNAFSRYQLNPKRESSTDQLHPFHSDFSAICQLCGFVSSFLYF